MNIFNYSKILSLCLMAVLTMVLTTSCNDEWTEEQYVQYVSFKAPLDDEGISVGVTTVNVPYTRVDDDGSPLYGEYGLSSYELPVIVSGTTSNTRDLTVYVEHDPDTLDILNYARFSSRTELYYNDMIDYATFDDSVFIPKGDDIGLLHIDLDFRGIDMAERYVLPLTIADDPNNIYERNPRKNYAKAMLRILPYTDFSGEYQATTMQFYIMSGGVTDTEPGAMSTVQAYVVDENTVFFYAGTFDESSELRRDYKVFAYFEPNEGTEYRGTVTLSAETEDMNFVQNKTATYTIVEEDDEVETFIMRRTVIINDVDYTFDDFSTANGSVVTYNVTGTMTMERKLNTQKPEEDQIEW